jgi:hypothetical protein
LKQELAEFSKALDELQPKEKAAHTKIKSIEADMAELSSDRNAKLAEIEVRSKTMESFI